MTRSRAVLLILLVLLGLAVVGCGGGDDETTTGATTEATTDASTDASGTGGGTTLDGSVGPGFEISLADTDGLSAGSYTLVVNDESPEHNFHLTGPGVDVATGVGAEGQESFEVELQAGEYMFVCDPHASQMNGSFTVD